MTPSVNSQLVITLELGELFQILDCEDHMRLLLMTEANIL